ncbi:YacL family protein [Vibrio proteolyticus]
MDFVFKKNALDGSYYCQCSMGHEIVGRWLQEEIGHEMARIEQVMALVAQARTAPGGEHRLLGREISLLISADEVIIEANALALSDSEVVPEEFELYDSESVGCCGLEDFEQLIRQWQAFIHG